MTVTDNWKAIEANKMNAQLIYHFVYKTSKKYAWLNVF